MTTIRFNEAISLAAAATLDASLPAVSPVSLIRDVYGRIRFAVNVLRSEYPADAVAHLELARKSLGAFAAPGGTLFRDDFTDSDVLFKNPDWHDTIIGIDGPGEETGREIVVRLLDRQIVGQYWLRTDSQESEKRTAPRIVFYGIKGGVGRSTALAMLAYRLASNGKRVLLLDLDLESPGLSGLLLPEDRVSTFGIVDWLVEDAVGQGADVLRDMLSDSPLADNTTGTIRIAPAMGQGESSYLAKLARVYADVPHADTGQEQFAARIQRLVSELEAQKNQMSCLLTVVQVSMTLLRSQLPAWRRWFCYLPQTQPKIGKVIANCSATGRGGRRYSETYVHGWRLCRLYSLRQIKSNDPLASDKTHMSCSPVPCMTRYLLVKRRRWMFFHLE